MSLLTEALERILNWLQQRPYAPAKVFEPGLTDEEIKQRVKDLPFKLPKEVYELYQWRNGTYFGEEDRAGFFDGLVFLSLEAAINKYEELLGVFQEEEDDWIRRDWEKNWFPIFAREDDYEDYLFIICKNNETESLPVFAANAEEPDIYKKYNSLTEMMLSVAKEFERESAYIIPQPEAAYFEQMSSTHPMTELTDALDRIIICLEENEELSFARFESLQMGISYEQIQEKIINLPLCLPREVHELYHWANGAWFGEEDWGRFFDYHWFMPLDSAVEVYYVYTCSLEPVNSQFLQTASLYNFGNFCMDEGTLNWRRSLWNSSWFPIFQDSDDNGYYIIVLDKEQQETTPVLYVDIKQGEDEPYIIYPSLTNMMLAEAEIYESGYYFKEQEIQKLNDDLRFRYSEVLREEAKQIRQKYQETPMKLWRSQKD